MSVVHVPGACASCTATALDRVLGHVDHMNFRKLYSNASRVFFSEPGPVLRVRRTESWKVPRFVHLFIHEVGENSVLFVQLIVVVNVLRFIWCRNRFKELYRSGLHDRTICFRCAVLPQCKLSPCPPPCSFLGWQLCCRHPWELSLVRAKCWHQRT